MSKVHAHIFSAMILALAGLGTVPAGGTDEKRQAPADPPVAMIGDTPITSAQLEQRIGSELRALRNQEYSLKKKALDDLIVQTLVERGAAARGISVEEFFRIEVESKAVPVTEEQKKAAYESAREQYKDRSEAEAMKLIEEGLKRQRLRERGLEFVKELREKVGVRVLLEPPRIAVDPSDDPSKGPEGAPVTIVEFSDFQCSFCAQVNATLEQVEERYRDKVRRVFRDFPLSMHKQAPKAAEAAACAHEQGRFWQMHDRLFANQGSLEVADLKRHAAEMGLKTDRFDRCLDSGKYTAEWQEDGKEGTRYGVSETPTFFINGRMLSGAQPFESFAQLIDEELERAAALKTAAAKPAHPRKKDPTPPE